MKASIRLAVFASTCLLALAALPTRAAEAVLPPAGPRIALGPGLAWDLRPAEAADGRRNGKPTGLGPARIVRLVYPALIEPR